MKLLRYRDPRGAERFGCLDAQGLVRALDGNPLAQPAAGPVVGRLEELPLLAPCQPTKVVGLAVNYRGATGYTPTMQEPLVFLKPATSVCGPQDAVACPFPGASVWGEAEVAIVIKRRLRHASLEEAEDGILGLTAANDISAENVDGRDHHLPRSKGADTFCPLGPWIDTAYDPSDRLVEALQNGQLIRRGRTSERVWTETQIVSWLSSWMTLEPWDVVLTGTPPRVGPRRYLADGDRFTVRIEGLAELTNVFHAAERPTAPNLERSAWSASTSR